MYKSLKGYPSKIKIPNEYDEYSNDYVFYYGKNYFNWIDGEFYGFNITTSAYKLNNCVKVGDNISAIDRLGGIKTEENHVWSNGSRFPGVIYWKPSDAEFFDIVWVTFYYDENYSIISFDAFIHDI